VGASPRSSPAAKGSRPSGAGKVNRCLHFAAARDEISFKIARIQNYKIKKMNQTWIEYAVIVAYLLLMIAIGVVFRNFNKNTGDYFRSGSQGTWWIVGMSGFMTGISALSFTGNGGAVFEAGWSVFFIYIGSAAGVLLHVIFLAPWFRQLRVTTFPQVVRARFGPATQQIYAYAWSLLFLLTGGMWLYALAIYCSTTFGLSMDFVIPVLGFVVLFYSTIGGKWAVLAADFVQGIIMMGMIILIAVLCLIEVGGFGGMLAKIQGCGLADQFVLIKEPGKYAGNAYTWQWAVAMVAVQVVSMCSIQSGSKYFAVKDGGEARRAASLTFVLKTVGPIFWFIPPIVARLLFADDVLSSSMSKPAEAAFAVASLKLLPAGLIGMMAVAMFSATMSSMDAGLNGNAAMFVNDIIPSVFRVLKRPLPSEKSQLFMGKAVTLMFGLIIIYVALQMSRAQDGLGVFEIALNVSSMLVLPMTLPLLLCLFIKKVPRWAAIFSAATTIIPSAMATFSETPWNLQSKIFWVLVTGTSSFLLSRLFWSTVDDAYKTQVDQFFKNMYRPVNFATEVGKPNDSRQLLIMGKFTFLIGIFTTILLAVPNPMNGRLCILGLAAGLYLIGFILVRAGKRRSTGILQDIKTI
jgi:Na+/proline symporter